jgi:hypothetical protein
VQFQKSCGSCKSDAWFEWVGLTFAGLIFTNDFG